ncbi:MAG: hypothetical protein ACYCOO_05215 [Chitinophagaceae bacterium]
MSTQDSDPLFLLIKTLTKAEKRHFKMYADSKASKGKFLFIQLFDRMEEMMDYQESDIFKKCPQIKKRQLSNIKNQLYKHLLTSLRLLYKNRDPLIDLREHFDYARVLYDRGLYLQSLKILAKIKTDAQVMQEIMLCHEIIEFEKLIESRHITSGLEHRAEVLSRESRHISQQISNISSLSTLSLSMYGLYLKMGHIRNEKDSQLVKSFFELHLPQVSQQQMGFYEKIYLYQAYCWYYYILQDFLSYYRYTQKWVNLFETFPTLKQTDIGLYIKALHNLLTAHFYTSNHPKFFQELAVLENFMQQNQENFDENTRTTANVYLFTARINRHFLEGSFSEGLKLVPGIQLFISDNYLKVDQHRLMVFYYKIACMYFGSGDNDHSLDYLNKIIQLRAGDLHSDIQCFARILHLIAHFEMENFTLLEYLVKSVYHFIAKHQDLGLVIIEIMSFLRKNLDVPPMELRNGFIELKDRLLQLSRNPFEKRSFLYLDIISWLESKIERQPVQTIIQNKFSKGIPRF